MSVGEFLKEDTLNEGQNKEISPLVKYQENFLVYMVLVLLKVFLLSHLWKSLKL